MRPVYHALYKLACVLGRPIGGIRPRRIYDYLGQRAFAEPEFAWFRNKYGSELHLSHSYHIDRNILIFGCYDAELHRALEQIVKPGNVCFDIGANMGEMTLHMAQLAGPSGAVHAFEPIPRIHDRLEKNIRRNGLKNVHLHRFALSNTNGTCRIASALSTQDNQGLASIVNTDDKALTQREEIAVRTLDDFVRENSIARIDVMKIDIQGAEMFLLEGGKKVFGEMAPDLFIEISPQDLKGAGFDSRDLCRALQEYGYTLVELRNMKRTLSADDMAPDFHATNVYCSKSPRSAN